MTHPAICYYIFPTYSQAKKAIWDSKDSDGRPFLDYIPKEIVESKHQQEMKIRLINGSLLQMVGSDNVDSIMGTNPKIVVFSEYAMQSPQAWDYIRPILGANGGVAIFISTPRGKNHFYDMYNNVKQSKDWFVSKCSVDDTGIFTKEDIERENLEGMSEELIQQEYYVSFSKGVEGSYYGRIIDKSRNEGRICNVPWETRSPVSSAWDLGFGDSMSIVLWQEIGRTHQDVAWELGLKTTILERERDLQVGIESARSLLSICYIDQNNCKYLIKCLENYQKKFNEKTQSYSETPLHSWASHMSDAFRYCGNARIQYGRGPGSLTPDKLNQIKSNAGFGPKQIPLRHVQMNPFLGR